MRKNYLFTSESVTEGHPDKICDQISDAVLDAILKEDPYARVACETTVTTGLVLLTGEISTSTYVDLQKVVRDTVDGIGYNRGKFGFDAQNLSVLVAIDPQSPDIAQGVNAGEGLHKEQGAGDQGIMFGFASNETEEFMPLPIVLAHKLARQLTKVRKDGTLSYLRPDGKTQVTVEYDGDDKPVRIDTIVVSSQHAPEVSLEQIREDVIKHVVNEIVPHNLLDEKTRFFINPTGKFVIGGPHGDAGLTGRKIIVDTYGGYSRHGGGAFSGKDSTKVDRSAAYAARHVCKNIVAANLADKCELQLSYAIGVSEPTSIFVDTFGTGKLTDDELSEIIAKEFKLSPSAIIESLELRTPIFKQTAAYGHFGRNDLDLPWERLNRVEDLKKYL